MDKEWFSLKQLKKNIWGIAEFYHFEKAISYLFIGNSKALLFDSGMGVGDLLAKINQITNLPVIVFNSHSHYDHIGGNYQFQNIIIYDHTFRKMVARKGYSHNQLKIFKGYDAFNRKPYPLFDSRNYYIKPFLYNKIVSNNSVIEIEPFEFVVIHTPGHTSDSVCLYERKNKILLSGDTFYKGPIYLHFKESDVVSYIKSLEIISKLDVNVILPGHNDFLLKPKILTLFLNKLLSVRPENNDQLILKPT